MRQAYIQGVITCDGHSLQINHSSYPVEVVLYINWDKDLATLVPRDISTPYWFTFCLTERGLHVLWHIHTILMLMSWIGPASETLHMVRGTNLKQDKCSKWPYPYSLSLQKV